MFPVPSGICEAEGILLPLALKWKQSCDLENAFAPPVLPVATSPVAFGAAAHPL